MTEGINDPTLDIYTPTTQVLFSFEPTRTMEYRDYARVMKDEPSFQKHELDNHAVLMPTKWRMFSFPVLFEKWPDGWRLDWSTFLWSFRHTGSGKWYLWSAPHAYFFALRSWSLQPPKRSTLWKAIWSRQLDPGTDVHGEIARVETAMAQETASHRDVQRLADIYMGCWVWPRALLLYWKAAEMSGIELDWSRVAQLNQALQRHNTAYEAYRCAQQAVTLPPAHRKAFYQRSLGFCKLRLQKFEEALVHFDKLLEISRSNGLRVEEQNAHFYTACTYYGLGQKRKLRRALRDYKAVSGKDVSETELEYYTR